MNMANSVVPVLGEHMASDQRAGGQRHSLTGRKNLFEAATNVIGEVGIAKLTNRSLARRSDLLLGDTAYTFPGKSNILQAVSHEVLSGYVAALSKYRIPGGANAGRNRKLNELAVKLLMNTCQRNRTRTLCWANVTLAASRNAETLALGQRWSSEFQLIWQDIARNRFDPSPKETAQSLIDSLIGFQFMTLPLGLRPLQIDRVLLRGGNPLDYWAVNKLAPEPLVCQKPDKDIHTKDAIIAGTVSLLAESGVGAISYQAVAERAGLSRLVPPHYFPTIESILGVAQGELLRQAKCRYRAGLNIDCMRGAGLDRLVDRTCTTFLREVTEFAPQNLGLYEVWLEAAYNPILRPFVWASVRDQHQAWLRAWYYMTGTVGHLRAIASQALFVGKIIRILSTGSRTSDLEMVRSEFAVDFFKLRAGQSWLEK